MDCLLHGSISRIAFKIESAGIETPSLIISFENRSFVGGSKNICTLPFIVLSIPMKVYDALFTLQICCLVLNA